jgi:hypothetical protein
MKEFEYNGMWWLPEKPKNRISGVLKFHPIDGANLELFGSFKKPKDFFEALLKPNIILGITSDSEIVTLYRCCESTSNISMSGILSSSLIVNMVLIGHHFEKEEDIIFDSLSLNYSHLEEWTKITGFHIKFKHNSKNHNLEYEVKYSYPPKKVIAKLNKLNISFDYYFNFFGDGIKEVNSNQISFIKLKPYKPLHFNYYQRNICYHIQNFLCLAIGEAVYPLIIKGKTKACITERSNGNILYNDILIFYPMKNLSGLSKRLHDCDILFSFDDISDNLEKYLSNWLVKSDVLKPVYDLYFGYLYNPKMYLQNGFLNLIQALESYHRRIHNGKYLSDDNYTHIHKTLNKAIPQEVKDDFRKSIKQKLKYLNEFSLRKRLKEILEKCGDVVNIIIHDNERFIEDVVKTRNFLTHYDKNIEMEAKSDEDLIKLVQKLKFILEICFLIELEIPVETITSLISRNKRYKYLEKL